MPLTSQELQSKLWQAADILRGQIDSADYKNYIFSILFLKRLSDRFDEEVESAVNDAWCAAGDSPRGSRTSMSSSCRRTPGWSFITAQGHGSWARR